MTTDSPPKAPDPSQVASAQTGENISTAIANSQLSHVNQTNAYGDTTNYNQTGSSAYTDPVSGKTYQIPQYSQTTQLSAPQQQLYNTVQGAQQGAADTAKGLIGQAQQRLSSPLDLGQFKVTPDTINQYTNRNWEQPFNDTWNQKQANLDQQLADQGLTTGSQAWNNAQRNFGQELENSRDQYSSSMYGNAINAALGSSAQNAGMATQMQNQPINELSGLLSNSQISSPNFGQVSQTNIPTTDYANIANQGYANQLAGYNAQQKANSNMYSGLFGLGGTLLSAMPTGGASLIPSLGNALGASIFSGVPGLG